MRRRVQLAAIAIPLACAVVLSGCGSSDTPKPSTASSAAPTSAAASPSSSPSPAAATQAEVTAALASQTGATPSVVKVGEGYDAATLSGDTGIDFWRYDGSWRADGSNSHAAIADAGSGNAPEPVKLSGNLLTGSNHATFIATGAFTGDGTGDAQAFGRGSSGWGLLQGQSDGSLQAGTEQGSSMAGLELEMRFSQGQLQTSSLWGPDSTAAFAVQTRLPVDRTFGGNGDSLKLIGSNKFTAEVTGSQKNLGQAPSGQPTGELPDGTWLAFLNSARQIGEGAADEASYELSIDGLTTQSDCSSSEGEQLDNGFCYVHGPTQTVTLPADAKTDIVMVGEADGVQVTAPGWVFANQYTEESLITSGDYGGLNLDLFSKDAPYYVPPGTATSADISGPFVEVTLQGGQVTNATSYFTS